MNDRHAAPPPAGRTWRLLAIVGPGILVAATGVGAGDLASGAFAGGKLGVAILWAVLVGAGLKYLVTEGLARWQLATGDSLLEGCVKHLGRPAEWIFLAYLLAWSLLVGSALISACGITAHAILPLRGPDWDKVVYGLLHSAAAVALVLVGGYRLFGRVMSVCIGAMFVVAVLTAIVVQPSWSDVAKGLFWPTIPDLHGAEGEGLAWTIALLGGVGGTLTVLSYGYWIREEGRHTAEDLKTCRIDLAVGYTMTALFGISMIIIGSRVGQIDGDGATLVVRLAAALENDLGPIGTPAKWAFLVGAWGAVFSSLLGVWQSVPYLFADFYHLTRARPGEDVRQQDFARSRPYRIYLFALATIPAAGLWWSFEQAQKAYAVFGALFIPMLAVVLLLLNGQAKFVGARLRNSWWTALLLVAALIVFLLAGAFKAAKTFS